MCRFIVIKYAHCGLVETAGLDSRLANILYTMAAVMSTSYNFLVSFCPLIPQISQYRYEKSILRSFILLQFKNVAKFQFVKMILINVAASAFMCTLFCGVQFLKKSRSYVRKRYQTNIVTFDQNFYFYLIVTLINMILTVFVVCLSGETTELVLTASYLTKLLSIWLFRPLITLIQLKRNMPEFFQDYAVRTGRFIFISQPIYPRRQRFMTFKQFNQNARFGTEKKFFITNEILGHQVTSKNSLKINENQNIERLPDVCCI